MRVRFQLFGDTVNTGKGSSCDRAYQSSHDVYVSFSNGKHWIAETHPVVQYNGQLTEKG
jgi:hypothetical protein